MTFSYESFTSSKADEALWSKINNSLNGLDINKSTSVKIASSDMKGKDARAIIIVTDSKAPNESTLGTTWYHKVFETGSDYEGMYTECVDYLNQTNELNDTQKYYARLTMTNASGSDSRLVLYWRG